MKVLAVDPGYDRLGVAVLERSGGVDVLLYSGCIEPPKSAAFIDRLLFLGEAFVALLKKHTPDALAVETLFFNRNQKTAIGVAQARGVILFLGKQHSCAVREFGPQEVKVAVTGYGKSDKAAVISMVHKLLPNAPDTAHDDEYDAIAVGITCLAHFR
ncbi:crossover junction endodeoxyribonuclease RuvC [Candidatus Kaiserbacteria bacterium]|nr:crossover junction endodeoxyribonuclease RuvC [Candidatus Kaiserbacteria bacterium]